MYPDNNPQWSRLSQESPLMLHGTVPSTIADGGHYDPSWSSVTDDDDDDNGGLRDHIKWTLVENSYALLQF